MRRLLCLVGVHEWRCVMHRGIGCRVECDRCGRPDVIPDCPEGDR